MIDILNMFVMSHSQPTMKVKDFFIDGKYFSAPTPSIDHP